MDKMELGFDIDGTICKQAVVKTPEDCARAERTNIAIPSDGHGVYLISTRLENLRDETEAWLAENGVEYEELILYDEGDFEGLSVPEMEKVQAQFKADVIDELGLDVYVEDRPAVRKHLREHCPDCMVLSPTEARKVWGSSTRGADR